MLQTTPSVVSSYSAEHPPAALCLLMPESGEDMGASAYFLTHSILCSGCYWEENEALWHSWVFPHSPFPLYLPPPASRLWVMLSCQRRKGRKWHHSTFPTPTSCLQRWPRSMRGRWKRQGEECWLGTRLPQQQQQLKQLEQWNSIGVGVSFVPPLLSPKLGKEEPCCSATDSPWKSRARHFWNTARELWVLIYSSDRFMMCKLWEHLPTCWKAAERETRWQTLGMMALSSIQLVYMAVWKDFMYCNLCTTRPRTWGCCHLQKSIPCKECLKLIHKTSTF